MVRNRKLNKQAVPENRPPLVEIPESEQWRIINETGILKQIPVDTQPTGSTQSGEGEEGEGLSPFAEEMFNAIMLIIPMSFMLLLMEMCVGVLAADARTPTHPPTDWYTISMVGNPSSGILSTGWFLAYQVRCSLLCFCVLLTAG